MNLWEPGNFSAALQPSSFAPLPIGTKRLDLVSQITSRLYMSMPRLVLLLLSVSLPLAASAQSEHPASGRKTIEVSATEKIEVIAEIATIKIGCQNQAPTKDAAYAENTRMANKVIQAMLDAGVPKEAIETETLSLEQEQDRYEAKLNQPLRYFASQKWQIRAEASEAQKIVDIAVAAGANQIENVEWSVKDPAQLEARAYAAALKRAKDLGEQTASQTGLKLGEIVSIVNSTSSNGRFDRAGGGFGMFAKVAAPKMAMLKLQLGMVEHEASVTITFSIVP
jgi:uncharacterized protein YggE